MNVLRLDEALLYLNRRRAVKGEPMIGKGEIAARVFDEVNPTTARQYWSFLKGGKRMSALQPRHIVKICEITGVSADYLLGLSDLVETFKSDNL